MRSNRVPFRDTFSASVGVAMWASVGIVCLTLLLIYPGCCVSKRKPWCKRGKRVVRKDMSMPSTLEALIEAVNVELEAGRWAQVSMLTVELYAVAVAAGETQLAELVQDLH